VAKYHITHTCGHIVTYDLVGKLSLRNYRINRMEQEACQECRNAARNQQSAEQANSAGLPELTGTEKQIAWATTIRQAFMGQVARVIVNLESSPDPRLAELAKGHDGRLDSYMVITDAWSESVEEESPPRQDGSGSASGSPLGPNPVRFFVVDRQPWAFTQRSRTSS
jgi:hypothetical protein